MNDWFLLSNADAIDSPALLFYPERIQENIRILKKFVPDVTRLRPHVKTNKCAEVCQLMLDAGITQFKCATIAEAEMLARLTAPDVLLAYQPLGPKVGRLIDLVKAFPKTKFSCLVDHEKAVVALDRAAQNAGITVNLFIDLNIGMNRTGIAPQHALALAREINRSPHLKLTSLHAYDGHLRDTDLAERTKKCDEGFQPVEALREAILKEFNTTLTVIAGGTPTFPIHAQRKEVQCSPGTFIFWDKGYQQLLAEQPFQFAALVLTRIVSLPDAETITTDLGHKAIASENPLANRVSFLNAPNLQAIGHSEEHLVLRAPKGHAYQVGDVLYGVPYHICPTVALHETAVVVTQQKATTSWDIVSRKRKISV
ncbi:MAG: D-TA family PLP-dependent enzyme [Bacteroidota bacterium]